MSASRSLPAAWMVLAYSTCLLVRLASALSASSLARMSRLLSGVRSSCDMFARNSDLYLDTRASCWAFSSSEALASAISRFFSSSSEAFSSSSVVRFSSSTLVLFSSFSSSSVRMLAVIMLNTTPMDSISCSRKVMWMALNCWNEASSITPLICPSNSTGSTSDVARGRLADGRADARRSPSGTSSTRMVLRSSAHCPTRPSPSSKRLASCFRCRKA